jgi:hypothetical protein
VILARVHHVQALATEVTELVGLVVRPVLAGAFTTGRVVLLLARLTNTRAARADAAKAGTRTTHVGFFHGRYFSGLVLSISHTMQRCT